jgi:hypothetical protein
VRSAARANALEDGRSSFIEAFLEGGGEAEESGSKSEKKAAPM